MIYRCEAVFDVPAGPYVVLLKAHGDAVRLECPPHEFGPFRPGEYYELAVRRVEPGEVDPHRRRCYV